MNTREVAKEYRQAHWTQIMQDRSASGLSIRAYCRAAGICETVYFYLQRKLREVACKELAVPGFTEVRVVESPVQKEEAESSHPGELWIKAGGVEITATSEYPVNKLAALLRELKQPC